jgi:hypothetical protein
MADPPHAATRAGVLDARDREALLRYVLRPPIAQDEIEHRPDGLVRITLKGVLQGEKNASEPPRTPSNSGGLSRASSQVAPCHHTYAPPLRRGTGGRRHIRQYEAVPRAVSPLGGELTIEIGGADQT